MRNQEISKLLYEIANVLELRGENAFKVRAYRRAAQTIEALSQPIEDLAKEGKLDTIPGVGASIAEKIVEFLEKGRIKYFEDLKSKVPYDFEKLMAVEGLGPKKLQLLNKKLKIKTLEDLEQAARSHRIAKLRGMGEKTEEKILRSIEMLKTGPVRRMLLGNALPVSEKIVDYMKKSQDVAQISAAGSLRRMKETIGDIDILVSSSHPDNIINHFCAMPDVINIIARGPTKASVNLKSGLQVDLRVLKESEYGAALLYFTGSKEHNIEMRRIAISKGLKLSEYGLFRGDKSIAGKTENDVYKALGLDYIEPEMREDRGEFDASRNHKLPSLVSLNDIKGDLQMHTKWSDGTNTIEEMARAAENIGYEYICITDHVGNLKIAHALSESDLERQAKEISIIQKKVNIKILHGAEVDIRLDGKFDISNACLKKLDIVVASLHSGLQRPDNTQRILSAMDNPHIDIIGHPTARIIDRRPGQEMDMKKIFQKARDTGKVMEIDGYMDRMDLNDVNARAAFKESCRLVIDTDSHSADQLRFMRLGVSIARRAWCQPKDILNTLPFARLAKEFEISN